MNYSTHFLNIIDLHKNLLVIYKVTNAYNCAHYLGQLQLKVGFRKPASHTFANLSEGYLKLAKN